MKTQASLNIDFTIHFVIGYLPLSDQKPWDIAQSVSVVLSLKRVGGAIKMGLFLNQPRSIFFCLSLMCSPICVLYRVIQDFVQNVLFSEIQASRSECDNYV